MHDKLMNVRKAYRLVFDYQSRILSLMKYIRSFYGLTLVGSFRHFSDKSPQNGNTNLDLWAWDWLNMYFYEFLFEKDTESQETYRLAVFLVSDTGYFQARKNGMIDKLNVQEFIPSEESKTELIFVAGLEKYWNGHWGSHWDSDDFMLQDEGEKNGLYFKHYLLEEFETVEGAKTCLNNFAVKVKEKLDIEIKTEKNDSIE